MRRILWVSIAILIIIFSLSSCKHPVESLDITFDDISLSLPEGEWFLGDEENLYEGEECSLFLAKSDDSDYSDYDRSFEFMDFSEGANHPYCDFMYVDGHIAEFYKGEGSLSMMIDYKEGYDTKSYYYLHFEYTENENYGLDDVKEILRSIRFRETGNHFAIAMLWKDAISDLKDDWEDGNNYDLMIQGTVEAVDHATESSGKPYYIDIGNPYPDKNRVTGVLWEENQTGEEEDIFSDAKGKEALLLGEVGVYDDVLRIRMSEPDDLILIHEIDDL